MKTKLKKGDSVIVTAGKNRGQQGKIVRVWPQTGRVLVEGANLIKKRERSRREGQKGQVLERAAPLAWSNIALWCPACGRGARAGYRLDGKIKTRICRRCENEI